MIQRQGSEIDYYGKLVGLTAGTIELSIRLVGIINLTVGWLVVTAKLVGLAIVVIIG